VIGAVWLLLLLGFTEPSLAQLSGAEYYVNTDPGSGSATAIENPDDGNYDETSEEVTINLDVSGLGVGQHVVYVRFQDAAGKWGIPKGSVFTVSDAQEIVFEITEAEYFIDSDPGEGNGTAFNTTQDGGFGDFLETVSTEISLPGLSEGQHQVYVRFKDVNGRWGAPRGQQFLVDSRADIVYTIASAEYFINSDPGKGNGIEIAAPADGSFDEKLEEIDLEVNLPGLAEGRHTIFTRFQRSNGSWGAKRGFTFTVQDGEEVPLTIIGAEYFVDTDPGAGNGTALDAPSDGSFDSSIEELEASFNVDGLNVGRHFAYFRVQGSNGRWGPARGVPFQIENIVFIDQAEYYFDSDPGQGGGTPITVSKDGNFDSDFEEVDLEIDMSTTGLDVGLHTMYIRFKNSKGEWSNPNSRQITVETRPSIAVAVDTLQFESIVEGDSLTQTFTVMNEGDAELQITNITSNLPDFTISPTSGSIPANSSDQLTFTVKYKPVSAGSKNGVISILNNDRTETIRVLGDAIAREPIMELSVASLAFGTVLVGDSVATQFAVYNTGYDVLTLSNISVNSDEFRVSPSSGALNAGMTFTDSLVINVALVPTSEGVKNATISLGGNVATQQISLSGEAQLNPEPTISLSTDSLAFGSVEIDETKQLVLEIRNLGTSTLNVTTFNVSGSAFTGTLSTPAAVERGSPLQVPITFSPGSASLFSGNVEIVSNDAGNSTTNVMLSGEGTVGPPEKILAVNPDSLDFGLVTVNESTEQSLTLINTGNATLKVTGINSDNSSFFVDGAPTVENPIFINAESSEDIDITFAPNQGGETIFTGNLAISSDRTDSSDPLTVKVSGTGVDQPTPNVQLSTRQLDFGELKLGENDTKSFKITNGGNADLNVSDIFTNDTDFLILSPSNTTFLLQPSESRDVVVQFEPTDVRVYTNRLSITSNIATELLDLFGSGVTLSTGVDSTQTRNQEVVVTAGDAIPITINPTGLGNTGSVFVYYKSGGGGTVSSYSRQEMLAGSGGAFTLLLPANISTSSGVSYWFEVTDGTQTVTSPELNPHLKPYTISVEISDGIVRSAPQPAGTDQNFYRLISVPLVDVSNTVSNVLGNFGDEGLENWRLFRWQSGSYVEHSESGFERFAPGLGYWFITSSVGSIQTGSGKSAPTDKDFSIFLQPGWNMIGSPFTYDTDWDNADIPSEVDNLWGYNGSGFTNVTVLKAWEGYFVNNAGNNPAEIKLSPIVAGGGAAKEVNSHPFEEGKAWSIQLKSSSGIVEDNYNFIGTSEFADDLKDQMDMVNAPNQPGEYLNLGIVNKEAHSKKLSIDAREPSFDGHVWDIEILSNSSDEHIKIEALPDGDFPSNFKLIAFDKDQQTVWSLDPTRINIKTIRSGVGAEIKRSFRIVAGTEAFIAKHNLGIKDIPAVFELKNNYPNPFNPSTTIVFGLPEASIVTIEVFNTLGQKIATLINNEMKAGYHDFIWDASRVSSGVYFYRMSANAIQSDARFTKLQKMTLIK